MTTAQDKKGGEKRAAKEVKVENGRGSLTSKEPCSKKKVNSHCGGHVVCSGHRKLFIVLSRFLHIKDMKSELKNVVYPFRSMLVATTLSY